MRLGPLICLAVILAGCATEPEVRDDPVLPPAPPPIVASTGRWSDSATWAPGSVPLLGDDVTIPLGDTVRLDVSPPALNRLTVLGVLEVVPEADVSLTAHEVHVRGTFRIGSEDAPHLRRFTLTLTGAPDGNVSTVGTKVLAIFPGGVLDIHGENRNGWTRLGATAPPGGMSLTLSQAMPWRAGDRIVVASTDFNPAEAEEAVIVQASGSGVTLDRALLHEHWGTVQQIDGRSVDQRAEVALLTRNITIQGDSLSTAGFGGHLIILPGATARIEGASFTQMGQSGIVGHYPVHWHMAGDVTGQYVRNVAIWRTHNRCLTIHGTDRAVARGNVCYDHLGHGYFLEDGAESGNTLENNLGLSARIPAASVRLLASDANPATFWLTNPDNIVRGNSAAGSVGFGFWYALPASPTGFSTGQPDAPRRTPLGEFTDNVAHSNRRPGLNVDDGPRPDGTTETNSYTPRAGAAANGTAVIATFRNFSGWKHTGRAVWLRGSSQRLDGAVLSDNLIGATFAASETFFENSFVVGESDNRTPSPNASFPIRGYEFYDGTVGATNVAFANFVSSPGRPASALGYNRANGFPISQLNFGNALRFVNSNGVFLEAPRADKDGDKSSLFRDVDGALTGMAGATVIADVPLLVSPGCTRRSEWNAWQCTNRFLGLNVDGEGNDPVAPMTIRRDDGVSLGLVGVPGNLKTVRLSVPASRQFDLMWVTAIPRRLRLNLQRGAPGDWIQVAIPYVPGLPFTAIRDGASGTPLQAASSLAEISLGTGEKYFLDAATGTIHVKLYIRTGRTNTTFQLIG
jgi:cell migration-inducing and hyaluronan-binding protein